MKSLKDRINESMSEKSIIREANNNRFFTRTVAAEGTDAVVEPFKINELVDELKKIKLNFLNVNNHDGRVQKMSSNSMLDWTKFEDDVDNGLPVACFDFKDGDEGWEVQEDKEFAKFEKVIDKWLKDVKMSTEIEWKNEDGEVTCLLIF